MGAWSEEAFGNDIGCDWIADFLENPTLAKIEEALDAVFEEDYVDSFEGSAGVAACEVIARLKGNWGTRDSYSEELDQWIEKNPMKVPDSLVFKALKVLKRVREEDSELKELWDEDGENDIWQDVMNDLKKRVQK